MTRALAHIGVYILHNTLLACQVFGTVAGEKFSVDIDNKAIRYYSGIFFIFIFILLLQVLVIWSLCFVCDCSQGYSECMRRWGQVELHPFDP